MLSALTRQAPTGERPPDLGHRPWAGRRRVQGIRGAGGLESDTPTSASLTGIGGFSIKTEVSILQRGGLGLDTVSAPPSCMASLLPSPFSS